MKKFFILLVAFTVSAALYAQKSYSWAWPDFQKQYEVKATINIDNVVADPFRPFDDNVGFALYGSRYRKAKHKLAWGNTLLFGGTVLSGALIITGINSLYDYDFGEIAILSGSAFLISSIWGGVKLWKKGRREIDSMMDDYVRQYAPAPKANESSLNFGPTSHGVGLSLNF
jgi:hypothetical protein